MGRIRRGGGKGMGNLFEMIMAESALGSKT